ncbi:hypothetical protein LguiA_024278 [Lonicera macranthoides]
MEAKNEIRRVNDPRNRGYDAYSGLWWMGFRLSDDFAAAELRQVFKSEIQRVGTEGAKVLRELGNKVEKMEKLRSGGDLLREVHEAAEELQVMIDQKSYHLVNSKSWVSGRRPKEFEDPDHFQELKDNEDKSLVINSLSEAALNSRSTHALRTWDPQNPNVSVNINNPSISQLGGSSEDIFKQQMHWPSRLSVLGDVILNEREVRTYESASALSLATFTSLLIEFVARLQNLVNSFEELSEKAKFVEPVDPAAAAAAAATKEEVVVVGFWTRLLRCLCFKD